MTTTSGIISPPYSRNGTESSSYTSTTFSSPASSLRLDDHSIVTDLNDFEDIGLTDDHDMPPRGRTRTATPLRNPPNSSLPTALRDLTHSQIKRPNIPNLHTSLSHSAVDHLSAKPRKPQSQPPAPRRAATTAGTRARSRNSSPAATPVSAHSNGVRSSVLNGVANGIPMVSPGGPRRMSWKEQRKRSELLEKEYDSDDDVPPDTIFCNVPLSPRSSRHYSNTPSPDRGTSPSPPTPKASDSSVTPPVTIEINGKPRQEHPSPTTRSKSWNDALEDLDPEAKELSEKLEEYADKEQLAAEQTRVQNITKQQSAQGKKGRHDSPPLPQKSSSSLEQSCPMAVPPTLPPLQISNGIIDPLPISKEKEAVLSRTRPAWLPPKSKEEEKRHLKEYQRMMRRSQDAERKRMERERAEHEARERMKLEHHNVWEKMIIPNWSQAVNQRETRELWWKGIAPRCRGQVWKLALGNHLAVSSETFKLALKRGKEIELGVKKAPSMYSSKERELFTTIQRDVKTTFEDMKIFQEKGPLHESLTDLLTAYAMYRSDVGYVYGTHVIAGLLLLSLPTDTAFVALANILNRPLPLAFYTQDESAISRAYVLFLKAFQYKLPSLFAHIHRNLSIPPVAYLEPMWMTLFALHCPPDITNRLWDVYVFEGDAFLVRTAIAVLSALESKLYGSREEVMAVLGWSATARWDLGAAMGMVVGEGETVGEKAETVEEAFMKLVRVAGKEEAGREMMEV